MLGLGGCMGRLLTIGVLAAAIGVVFYYRGDLGEAWRDLRRVRVVRTDAPPAAAPPLAESAETKLATIVGAGQATSVTLSQAEVQSLIDYRMLDLVPETLAAPRVELRGGRLRVQARIATEILSGLPDGPDLLAWLPDSTDLAATGQLIPLDSERVALAIEDVSASRIPLPRRVIPGLLDRLGRPAEAGLPEDAWAIPLPPGATDVYVRGDTLVVLARSGRTESE